MIQTFNQFIDNINYKYSELFFLITARLQSAGGPGQLRKNGAL